MLLRTVSRWLADFIASTSGGSPVEYAVFAGLTVGMALFGGELVGATMQTTFAHAASMAGGNAPHRQTPRRQLSPETPRPTVVAAEEATASDGLAWVKWTVAGLLLAAGGGVWYLLYARRKETEIELERAAMEAALPMQNLFKKRQAILKILSLDMSCLLDNSVTVGQLMSIKLKTVLPETGYDEVVQMMASGGHRHVLVTDPAGQLLGVISDRDVARKHVPTASELMTPDPVTVERSTLIGPAVTLLLERQFSCLPVVERGHLLGVLTTSDLIMALQCSLQLLCKIARATRTQTQEEAERVMAA
jgi:CBS domain-containing protein